jgi:hypothetical protein
MLQEIKAIDYMSAIKVGAVLGLIQGIIIGIVIAIISSIAGLFISMMPGISSFLPDAGTAIAGVAMGGLVSSIISGVIGGAIGMLVMALIYNIIVVKLVGGLKIDLE